jgi:hypothetical protein
MRVIEEAAKAAYKEWRSLSCFAGTHTSREWDQLTPVEHKVWIAAVEAALNVCFPEREKIFMSQVDDPTHWDFGPITQHWPCDVCGKDVVAGARQCAEHLDPQPVIVEPPPTVINPTKVVWVKELPADNEPNPLDCIHGADMIDPSTYKPDPNKIVQMTITTTYRPYSEYSKQLSTVDVLIREGDITKMADILRLIPESRAFDVIATSTDCDLWPEVKSPDAIIGAT